MVLCLVLAGGCSNRRRALPSAAAAGPQVAQLTAVDLVQARIDMAKPHDPDGVIAQETVEALAKLEGKIICMVTFGTDSVFPGPNNWRSCAKLGNNKAFGVSEAYGSVFIASDNQSCTSNPTGVVGSFIIMVPLGENEQADQAMVETLGVRPPSRDNIRIHIRFSGVSCLARK